jgi:uncharacterized membrane protein
MAPPPHHVLDFVGKSLMNRGATRCFCNVQLYYAKVITYWTIIENSMKSKQKNSGELGCTFGILKSVQWLEFYGVDFIIFRPNMSAIEILFTLGAITWSYSQLLEPITTQVTLVYLSNKFVLFVCHLEISQTYIGVHFYLYLHCRNYWISNNFVTESLIKSKLKN